MMESSSLLEQAIQQILEMSADLQIKRMTTRQYSLECHDHTVALAACGKVLGILTRLQQQEECSPGLALLSACKLPEDLRLFLS